MKHAFLVFTLVFGFASTSAMAQRTPDSSVTGAARSTVGISIPAIVQAAKSEVMPMITNMTTVVGGSGRCGEGTAQLVFDYFGEFGYGASARVISTSKCNGALVSPSILVVSVVAQSPYSSIGSLTYSGSTAGLCPTGYNFGTATSSYATMATSGGRDQSTFVTGGTGTFFCEPDGSYVPPPSNGAIVSGVQQVDSGNQSYAYFCVQGQPAKSPMICPAGSGPLQTIVQR